MRYILVLLFLAALPASAQYNKGSLKTFVKSGTFLLGGSVNGSFRSYTRDSPNENSTDKGSVLDVKGDARVGYFLLNNLALGVQTSVNHFNYKNETTSAGPKNTYLLYGPFVRGYVSKGVFGEAGLGFGTDNSIPNVDTELFEGRFAVGYSHFLNDKIAIEPILTLRYLQNKYLSSTGMIRQTEIGPSFGVAIQAFLFRGSMPVDREFRRSKY